jgi:hypothetical protein
LAGPNRNGRLAQPVLSMSTVSAIRRGRARRVAGWTVAPKPFARPFCRRPRCIENVGNS